MRVNEIGETFIHVLRDEARARLHIGLEFYRLPRLTRLYLDHPLWRKDKVFLSLTDKPRLNVPCANPAQEEAYWYQYTPLERMAQDMRFRWQVNRSSTGGSGGTYPKTRKKV
jgi:hypothetical protein